MISPLTRLTLPVLLVLAAAALAGCETTGVGAGAKPEAAKPVEPPMTRTRAAEQCWMATEKGNAGLALDKRADVVDKCIEQKMKAAASAPAS
jgi:type IV pilus biogenesis protein CpaD/CtpE